MLLPLDQPLPKPLNHPNQPTHPAMPPITHPDRPHPNPRHRLITPKSNIKIPFLFPLIKQTPITNIHNKKTKLAFQKQHTNPLPKSYKTPTKIIKNLQIHKTNILPQSHITIINNIR